MSSETGTFVLKNKIMFSVMVLAVMFVSTACSQSTETSAVNEAELIGLDTLAEEGAEADLRVMTESEKEGRMMSEKGVDVGNREDEKKLEGRPPRPANNSGDQKLPVAESDVDSQVFETCLNDTKGAGDCKDCCDCLEADVETRKACRDNCAQNDFSLNTSFIDFEIPSTLGRDGDYSVCTELASEQECKQCCDDSEDFVCGDFQYCRTACAQ